MKHLKKFNESLSLSKKSIFDYYLNLEVPQNTPDSLTLKVNQLKKELQNIVGTDLLDRLEKSNKIIYTLKKIEKAIDPQIYISVFTEKSGDKVYHGKLNWFYEDDNGDVQKKILGVYLGSVDNFNSKDDPKLIEMGKEKMREKILKII